MTRFCVCGHPESYHDKRVGQCACSYNCDCYKFEELPSPLDEQLDAIRRKLESLEHSICELREGPPCFG